MEATGCPVRVNSQGQELARHGSVDFPIAIYQDIISRQSVPWHWHEELEAIVVTQGTALLGCGSQQLCLMEGQGALINSGCLHGCWGGGEGMCRIESIVFHPRLVGGAADSVFFRRYLRPLLDTALPGGLVLSPEVSWQRECIGWIRSVWQNVNAGGFGYEFRVRQQLSQLLLLVQTHCAANQPPDNQRLRNARRIKQMLQYIHSHFAQDITVADIAQSAAISESECLRCFRATIHQTPKEYLRQYRIRQSAQLLSTTEEKISAVAAECGFSDMSFFAKTFREYSGMTPSEYRAAQRQTKTGAALPESAENP